MGKYIIDAINDTFISSKCPRTNYSTENYLLVENLGSNKCFGKESSVSLLQFDLSNIPCKNIKSAYLYIYVQDYFDILECKSELILRKINSYYNYQTVTWLSAPRINQTDKQISLNYLDNGYLKIDITNIINISNNWLCMSNHNYGLELMLRGNGKVIFSSSRGIKPPYMEINAECSPIIDYNEGRSFIKCVDKAFAQVGDVLTYTIKVGNVGKGAASNVILTDTIPVGTVFVNNSLVVNSKPISGVNSQEVVINLETIPAYSKSVVKFQVVVTTIPTVNYVCNSATVKYNYTDTNISPNGASSGGNSNSVCSVINQGELIMAKSVDKDVATIGDTLTYTVVLKNTGNTAAKCISFYDAFNKGLDYLFNSLAIDGTTIAGANPAISPGVNIGDLAPNSVRTLTFKTVVNTIPNPNIIQNFGIGYYYYTVNPSCSNSSFAVSSSNIVSTSIVSADISNSSGGFFKSVNKSTVSIPNTIIYTIVLKNTGNTTANNVILIDTVPSGTTFVLNSVVINSSLTTGTILAPGLNLGSLGPNKSVTISFNATAVSTPTPNPTLNKANVYYNFFTTTTVNKTGYSNIVAVTIINP